MEGSDLTETLAALGYEIPLPEPVGTYEPPEDWDSSTIDYAMLDIRERFATRTDQPYDLVEQISEAMVRDWEALLYGLQVDDELSIQDDLRRDQLMEVYRSAEADLQTHAAELGVGGISALDPAEVLFTARYRELQDAVGVDGPLNPHRFDVLRDEHYTVTGEADASADPDRTSLAPPEDEPARAETIRRQLITTGQVVFYGPPGTGKTYTAQRFARWWINQECEDPARAQLQTVTFHPAFSYEDFIEGLRASETETGEVRYAVAPGIFRRIAEAARDAYEDAKEAGAASEAPPFVLLIDEINRGNLSDIFGELITALEYDKRQDGDGEADITLTHSGDPFTVPPNLHLIGTMNTADRSISLVDAALRRRFRFISFPPDYEVLYDEHGLSTGADIQTLLTEADTPFDRLIALSIAALEEINETIIGTTDFGKGKQLGHSYLYDVATVRDIVDAWRYDILPLLEEYFFGQFNRIQDEIFAGNGDALLDTDTHQFESFEAPELAQELASLLGVENLETEGLDQATLDGSYQESLPLIVEAGLLSEGDELVLKETHREQFADRTSAASDPFWRARYTGNDSVYSTVEWLEDGEQYSLTKLANTILEEGGLDAYASGTDVWIVRDEGDSIYELAQRVKNERASFDLP